MTDLLEKSATFSNLADATREDLQIVMAHEAHFATTAGKRVLDHLRLLEGDFCGCPVDRLEHSLQCATLAYRDGRDAAYVVMALLHDIGDTLGVYNHQDIAAAILKPFVSDELLWIVQHHAIFQGYNYLHHIDMDRNQRDKFRGHPYFDATAEFVEKYDCPAFNPAYESLPLDFFVPLVMELFRSPIKAERSPDLL